MTHIEVIPDLSDHTGPARQFLMRHGLEGKRPTIALLRQILALFSKLPYENLSKIIKYQCTGSRHDAVRLPDEVFEAHLRFGLGGTCFSLTFSLLTLLHRSGFKVSPVMADMAYGPNTHCALILHWMDGIYLIDPGYLLTDPMPLTPDGAHLKTAVSIVDVLFDRAQGIYHLWTTISGQRKWRYSFSAHSVSMATFFSHWRDSFQWNGMHGLCLNKLTQDRMVYVHKNFMCETSVNGKVNHRIKDHYHHTIARVFSIDPQIVEQALAAVKERVKMDQALKSDAIAQKAGA